MPLLFTFGCGPYGELGHGHSQARPEPVAVPFPSSAPHREGEALVEAVALGTDHSLALVGGQAYRWGLHGVHAVPRSWRGGRWETSEPKKPEVVPAPQRLRKRSPSPAQSPRRTVAAIACGGSNSYLLTADGEVLLYGGLWPPGGATDQLRHLWGTPRGGPASKVAMVAAGWRHCLFVTEAGHVFALGDDEFGQCAGQAKGTAAVPLPSAQKALGVAAGACHSMAWDAAGAAYAWGHGGSGRLGLGSTAHRSGPERVEAQDVVSVSCGANFSLLLTHAGRLWACGGNNYGQLGNDSTRGAVLPQPVALPESVRAVSCGANHVVCLTKTQERNHVWVWGSSASGQCSRLKDQLRPLRLSDFAAPSPHLAVAVAAGRSHSAVLVGTSVAQSPRLSPRPSPRRASPRRSPRRSPKASPKGEDIIDQFLSAVTTSGPAALVELREAALQGEQETVAGPRLGRTPLRARRPQKTPKTKPRPERRPVEPPAPTPAMPRPVAPATPRPVPAPPPARAPAGRLLAEALEVAPEDKWSGIHASLQGLSSLIAKIGSPERRPLQDVVPLSLDQVWPTRAEPIGQRPPAAPQTPKLAVHQPWARRLNDSLSDADPLDFSPRSEPYEITSREAKPVEREERREEQEEQRKQEREEERREQELQERREQEERLRAERLREERLEEERLRKEEALREEEREVTTVTRPAMEVSGTLGTEDVESSSSEDSPRSPARRPPMELTPQGGTSSLARPSTSPEVERILASISASDDEGDWV